MEDRASQGVSPFDPLSSIFVFSPNPPYRCPPKQLLHGSVYVALPAKNSWFKFPRLPGKRLGLHCTIWEDGAIAVAAQCTCTPGASREA